MANLKIKNLQKGFEGFSIIKGIDLEVNDREFVVFVGPSGCGKSTLLRLIAGLEEVSDGTIELDGRDITEVSPAKRDLAMVFQTYALYPHMSVRKNMSFALDLAGVPKAEVEKKVNEAARILELGPMLERKPKQLSRRPAPACSDWPGHRAQPENLPVRRTPVQPRRGPAGADAPGTGTPAQRVAGDHDLRDSRPGRSHDPGRQGGGAQWRAHRTGRFTAGAVSPASQPVCRRVPRHAENGLSQRQGHRPGQSGL